MYSGHAREYYADNCDQLDDEAFAQAIAEDIKGDIRCMVELMACASFGDLYEVCDANELGGLCEEDHPVWDLDLEEDTAAVVDRAQDIVDEWIKGGHK